MRAVVIFAHDADSVRPRLVVRAGRVGRGVVVAEVVLPPRLGLYRLGYVDALLLLLRTSACVSFDSSFHAWYGALLVDHTFVC